MVRYFSSIRTGISLQVIFVVLYFGIILPKLNNIIGATTCLIIGLLSLINGIFLVESRQNAVLSFVVITIAVLILMFTIVAYFLGEPGYQLEILQ